MSELQRIIAAFAALGLCTAALYGIYWLREPAIRLPLKARLSAFVPDNVTNGAFSCQVRPLSSTNAQLSFTISCTPNCSHPPSARSVPYPADPAKVIVALYTTPAIWHRTCDKTPGTPGGDTK